jgi:hypothetical protein
MDLYQSPANTFVAQFLIVNAAKSVFVDPLQDVKTVRWWKSAVPMRAENLSVRRVRFARANPVARIVTMLKDARTRLAKSVRMSINADKFLVNVVVMKAFVKLVLSPSTAQKLATAKKHVVA